MTIFPELEKLGLNCWRSDWDQDYNRYFHGNVSSLFNSGLKDKVKVLLRKE